MQVVKSGYDPRIDRLIRDDQRFYWSIYVLAVLVILLIVLAGALIPWSRIGLVGRDTSPSGSSDPIATLDRSQPPFQSASTADSSRAHHLCRGSSPRS